MSKKENQAILKLEEMIKDGILLRGSDKTIQFNRIPFNIEPLDILTGGGIPRKRITLLTGPTNAGKSYLASQIVKSAINEGGKAVWVDTELSWDPNWMIKCGLDIERVFVSQPVIAEDAFNIVREVLKIGVDVVVLDSIAGLAPSQLHEEDFSFNPIAWQARFVNQSLPRILPYLKNNSVLVLINQLRANLGPVSLSNMPGGEAQKFFSHFLLEVRRSGWINDGDRKIGFDMEISLKKSKVGGKPFESCIVPFKLEGGIDLLETEIREAIANGRIEHTRAWYRLTWNDTKLLGMDGVRKYFKENLEETKMLKEK